MESDMSPSQGPAHRQPQPGAASRPMVPGVRRPSLDGFAPRRPGMPINNAVRPTRPSVSIPVMGGDQPNAPRPVQPTQASQPEFRQAAPMQPQFHPQRSQHTAVTAATASQQRAAQTHTPVSQATRHTPNPDAMSTSKSKQPKEHNHTGHAGLVGFATLIVLGALFLAPIIPGKIMQNFPLSSQTFSTGNQALDCIGSQGQISTTTKYTSKIGSPLNYAYSTTSTESATCNGKSQSATTGHASQFSPLALVVDIIVVIALAVGIAKIWRLIFGEKPHKR